MSRVFSKKVYTHPNAQRNYYHKDDMIGWCEDHGEDSSLIEVFDSVAEYNRWLELQQQERDGIISELRRQVKYLIIPGKVVIRQVGSKIRKVWYIPGIDGKDVPFMQKKECVECCRRRGIKLREIRVEEEPFPVIKAVRLSNSHYYTADFVYMKDGKEVVEDCKSKWTRKEKDYVLRRDLMLDRHGIEIYEYVYDGAKGDKKGSH